MLQNLESRAWWGYLGEDLQELVMESILLGETFSGMGADLPAGSERFHDYSFVVFPAAKAYEGFLKKLFLDMRFISQEDYSGKRFRVGKALNPALEKRFSDESVYDKLTKFSGGKELANKVWEAWRRARNLTFHWFPNEKNAITLDEAKGLVSLIIDAIEEAYKGCKPATSN